MRVPAQPDPDLLHRDPAEWQRQYDAYNSFVQQATLAQLAMPFIYNQAAIAKQFCQSDPKWANIWQKYGAEVDAEIVRVPIERHTRELYDKACEIVKGRHAEEIGLEFAKRYQNASSGTERSGSAGAPPGTPLDPIDELFTDDSIPYVRMQKSAGITPAMVRSYISKRKQDSATFVAQVKQGTVIFDPARGTTLHNT